METDDQSSEGLSPSRSSLLGKLVRLIVICLFLFTLTYTVVRESKDAWLWKHLFETPIQEIEDNQSTETIQSPEVDFAIDYQGAEDNLKKELLLAQSTLTLAMEERLEKRLASLQEAHDRQIDHAIDVKTTVSDLVSEILEQSGSQGNDVEVGKLIKDIGSGLTALQLATNDLDHAVLLSKQTHDDLLEMGEISESIYDERNYHFHTYQVGRNETLREIAQKVQDEYSIPEANLSLLISIFNELKMGVSRPGNRRMPIRIVLNKELRIPVPKNAGELSVDFKIPEKLEEQQLMITSAQEEQRKVSRYLSESIESLRATVERVEAIKELAFLIQENVDRIEPESFQFPGSEPTVDQQQAWKLFNHAVNVYQFDGGETEAGGLSQLREATRGLMQAYDSDFTDRSIEENLSQVSDIVWFKEFIQRYDPGQSTEEFYSADKRIPELETAER